MTDRLKKIFASFNTFFLVVEEHSEICQVDCHVSVGDVYWAQQKM